MDDCRIAFESLEWQSPVPGARSKSHCRGNRQFRLLELSAEFVEPDWCSKGHTGLVVRGELEIDFQGRLVRFPEGSGIVIPPGSGSAHKARSLTATALLFLVEEV